MMALLLTHSGGDAHRCGVVAAAGRSGAGIGAMSLRWLLAASRLSRASASPQAVRTCWILSYRTPCGAVFGV